MATTTSSATKRGGDEAGVRPRRFSRPLERIPIENLPSKDELDAARTAGGGWDRDRLASWGVPWPPPRRWRQDLLQRRAVADLYSTRDGIASVAAGHGDRCPCDCCLAAGGDDDAWARVRALA